MRTLHPVTRDWICHLIQFQLKAEFIEVSENVQDKNQELRWLTLIEILKGYHDLSIMVTPNTLGYILIKLIEGNYSTRLSEQLIELTEQLTKVYSNAKLNMPYEYNLKLYEVIDMAQQGLVFNPNHQVFTNVNY